MHIFVYGTLRRGERAYETFNLANTTNFVRTTAIKGTMFSLGGFPGVVCEGEGTVVGDLLELHDATAMAVLRALDGYEGVPHLYTRETVKTACGVDTAVYVYAGRHRYRQEDVIPNGDWINPGKAA